LGTIRTRREVIHLGWEPIRVGRYVESRKNTVKITVKYVKRRYKTVYFYRIFTVFLSYFFATQHMCQPWNQSREARGYGGYVPPPPPCTCTTRACTEASSPPPPPLLPSRRADSRSRPPFSLHRFRFHLSLRPRFYFRHTPLGTRTRIRTRTRPRTVLAPLPCSTSPIISELDSSKNCVRIAEDLHETCVRLS